MWKDARPSNFPSLLNASSCDTLQVALDTLQVALDTLKVCTGHPESHFVAICESKQGDMIRSRDGSITALLTRMTPVVYNGDMYPSTVRTS
jgi:hypothetical protein